MISHNNKIEEDLFKMYNNINLGSSVICKECHEKILNLSSPVSFWFVGKNFNNDNGRVLFIGKNARDEPGERKQYYVDSRCAADYLWNGSWSYWSYIRNIAEEIYGENGAEHIAYTNIIKCNNSDTIDNTSKLVKDNCIKKMQVLRREIQLLKPKKIVFLTSWYYDEYLVCIFDSIEVIEDKNVPIGSKSMPWREFHGYINNNLIEVLRVGHPERKKKSDYVNIIVKWLSKN